MKMKTSARSMYRTILDHFLDRRIHESIGCWDASGSDQAINRITGNQLLEANVRLLREFIC